jgi:hypothetical protein
VLIYQSCSTYTIISGAKAGEKEGKENPFIDFILFYRMENKLEDIYAVCMKILSLPVNQKAF